MRRSSRRKIDPRSVFDALIEIGKGDCEAVFASCTNLRAFEVIEEAEAAIGKPVLCSNQVMAWHMLQIAGLNTTLPGRGRIFANT
jgi:maleate isomerase